MQRKTPAQKIRRLYSAEGMTPRVTRAFRAEIWRHYRQHGRDFEWRRTRDPYRILVSEVMLQQTQTSRVATKYPEFLAAFPDVASLAAAPVARVLEVWQGMGYNRRALALTRLAREVMMLHGGTIPDSTEALRCLPGIGSYTANAVAALAFDRPTAFIETNIREVFRAFFFGPEDRAGDPVIMPLVAATVDRRRPRQWYYALFDYGVMLKRSGKGEAKPGTRRQAPFAGSNRQLRGGIIRYLLKHGPATTGELVSETGRPEADVVRNLDALAAEGFIARDGDRAKVAE